MTEIKRLRDTIEPWEELISQLEDAEALLELAEEDSDQSQEAEIQRILSRARRDYDRLQLKQLLSEEADGADAFLTIHSGAGGTEACDWVSMLFRMYTRWIDNHDLKRELLDMQEAEGGIKSVTLELTGAYAFGYLKAEAGIHRLVRISPFDSSGRRHTSFASVYVSPVIEDSIEVDVRPEDLRVDTYRASGAGGQHVNKTESAIRITHIPTGIVSESQDGRSQHKNKEIAMTRLLQRIQEQQRSAQESELAAKRKSLVGSGDRSDKIRTYNFPQNRVTDHRINLTLYNLDQIMDGQIEHIIEALQMAENAEKMEAGLA
jgi:peptide chain release factor 2